MPFLGAEMEFGRLVEWKVKPGDLVKKQDIIAVVDTDKAAIEIECWQSGVVEKLVVEPGAKVPVGAVLALIREASQDAIPTDIQDIKPTEKSQETQSAAMQKVIAAAMAKSKREIPHYYLSYTVDMTKSLSWLEAHNSSRPVTDRLIYATLLIKAVALAIKNHPEFNGFWINDGFKKADDINVGIVISLRQGGLLAPAICKADRLNLQDLMKNMSDVVVRARSGSLRSSEVENPTITITNLGEYGVDSVFGVIYPPQVAIVGFGRITSQKSIIATLSADHRASDGHKGSQFLRAIAQHLQSPEKL